MSSRGDNNPRGPFSDVVGLRVWRSSYAENKTSQLFIDVAFKEGRLGAEADSPVRFRMSLKRAEVRIRLDTAKILSVVNGSVPRATPLTGKRTTIASQGAQGTVGGGAKFTPTEASIDLNASGSLEKKYSQAVEFAEVVAAMAIQTWPNSDGGYSFILTPDAGKQTLFDRPWDVTTPRALLKDPSHPRSSSEPPEPLVQICCAVEDINIVDVEFKDRKAGFFENLDKEKRLAVVQYIRQQLTEHGMDAGSSGDGFAVITIADATPQEDDSAV